MAVMGPSFFDELTAFDGCPAEVDAYPDLDRWSWRRWRRWRYIHGRRRSTQQSVGSPAGSADGNFCTHHGGRNLNVDHGAFVGHGCVNLVDHSVARPFTIVSGGKVANVPVGAARQLKLDLRRRLIPVVVRTLDVAVNRVTELDFSLSHGMSAVVGITRAFIVEGGWIADEVELAAQLTEHARIFWRVVMHVRHFDGAETAAKFVWHRVLRQVPYGLGMRHVRIGEQKRQPDDECAKLFHDVLQSTRKTAFPRRVYDT
jgi:hypothetical protein